MCDCVRVCDKCKCEVVFDDDLVTKNYEENIYNYDCACLVCDEDLDLWETSMVQKDEVKMLINDKHKKYYKEHGYL